ncbi:hypothetical protein ABK040_011533 [Willaertia magna]
MKGLFNLFKGSANTHDFSTTTTNEKSSTSSSIQSPSSNSSSVSSSTTTNNEKEENIEQITFDLRKPFPPNLLTDIEKQRVEKMLDKLNDHKEWLEKQGKLLEQVGFTGDIEVDAQNSVCEDRFNYLNFGIPILKTKNERKSRASAPSMNVKLVLSALDDTLYNFKLFRRIAAGVINTESFLGITHSSLLIGQWRIEWFNTSLVSIRCDDALIFAKNAIGVLDLGNFKTIPEIENAFKEISRISCEYNSNKIYDIKECNCHHFVQEIIKALHLSIPDKGPLKQYFKELKKGENRRIYKYSESLKRLVKEKIGFQEKYQQYYNVNEIEFMERKQIDDFCWWLNDSLDYFETEEGKLDFPLLKGFDRSFVLNRQTDGLVTGIGDDLEEKSFFGIGGAFMDNSINRIKYNVQTFRVPSPNRK